MAARWTGSAWNTESSYRNRPSAIWRACKTANGAAWCPCCVRWPRRRGRPDARSCAVATTMPIVRVGDYRILYTIDDGARTVLILRIAHRREVYR